MLRRRPTLCRALRPGCGGVGSGITIFLLRCGNLVVAGDAASRPSGHRPLTPVYAQGLSAPSRPLALTSPRRALRRYRFCGGARRAPVTPAFAGMPVGGCVAVAAVSAPIPTPVLRAIPRPVCPRNIFPQNVAQHRVASPPDQSQPHNLTGPRS